MNRAEPPSQFAAIPLVDLGRCHAGPASTGATAAVGGAAGRGVFDLVNAGVPTGTAGEQFAETAQRCDGHRPGTP